MKGLRLLGGGIDAVLTTTATPSAEKRLARYRLAAQRNPRCWQRERVELGQILQDAIKTGYRVYFHTGQGQLPPQRSPLSSGR